MKTNMITLFVGILISLFFIFEIQPGNAGAVSLLVILSVGLSYIITTGVKYVAKIISKKP